MGNVLLVLGNVMKGTGRNHRHTLLCVHLHCSVAFSLSPSNSLRPSMSGLHLVKQGRDRKKVDVQRDFTVASPAEFVTRFGGNRVIEKVNC